MSGRPKTVVVPPGVKVAQVGEDIVFPSGWPVRDRHHVVKPQCPGASGAWACVTHKLIHRNNLEASSHEGDGQLHLIVWLCDEHGPEVP